MTEAEHDNAMGDFNTIAMSQPGDKLIAIRRIHVTDTESDNAIDMDQGEYVTIIAGPQDEFTVMPYLYGMAGLGDRLVHVHINANWFQDLMVVERRSMHPTVNLPLRERTSDDTAGFADHG